MTELKTLKDFDLDDRPERTGYTEEGYIIGIDVFYDMAKEDLRQEAIKWIKTKFLEQVRDWSERGLMGTDSYAWGAYSEFMKFFNITEEDLK